jgi:Holliday junction resolvase RusA-like endonuclease
MIDCIYFCVEGQPVGKGRPRFGNGRAYTPKKTADYEKRVAQQCQLMMEKWRLDPIGLPIKLHVHARFEIPKSWTKKKKEMAEKELIYPNRPDIDNIAKSIMDGMNGVLYEDDCQVYELLATKKYSKTPGVTVLATWSE